MTVLVQSQGMRFERQLELHVGREDQTSCERVPHDRRGAPTPAQCVTLADHKHNNDQTLLFPTSRTTNH